MSPRPAAKWASPVVSRSVVTAPGRVLKVVRVVSSDNRRIPSPDPAAGREARLTDESFHRRVNRRVCTPEARP